MKFLYVTTIGGTMRFFKQLIRELVEDGHTVDIATNTTISNVPNEYIELGCKVFPLSCTRSPLNKGTLTAIKELKKIVSTGDYDLVHCHTPIAALCTRLACRKARKRGTKVVYTAHGFHFYKGAPLKNWLVYYPIEKICAHFTDVLITINKEDYDLAQKKMRAKKVEYVPGVGIDVSKFANAVVDRDLKRDEIGVPRDAFLLLSVGELSERKNHETAIKAMATLENSSVHYIIAGKGGKQEYLRDLSRNLGIETKVHLLGYRNDIAELCKISDAFLFPSFQEGLPVSIMEAMASGLPIVCGSIRGNIDLVDKKNGVLFNPHSVTGCAESIKIIQHSDLTSMREYNFEFAKTFEVKQINERMIKIFEM